MDRTKRRITEINQEVAENKQAVIWSLFGFLLVTVFMLVPYGFLLSGMINNSSFMTIFVFVMLTYMFYIIYKLDIYHIRTTIEQTVTEIGIDEWRKRIAEYLDENCDCKLYNARQNT